MNSEFNGHDLSGFLKRNRPGPSVASPGEYARILRAVSSMPSALNAAPRFGGRRTAFALAACLLIAVVATLTVGGDRPSTVAATEDERVEVFLDDTMSHVLPVQSQGEQSEPFEAVAFVEER